MIKNIVLWNNCGDVSLVSECPSINDRNVKSDSDFIYIIPLMNLENYLASILSRAMTTKLNCLKKLIGSSLMFL